MATSPSSLPVLSSSSWDRTYCIKYGWKNPKWGRSAYWEREDVQVVEHLYLPVLETYHGAAVLFLTAVNTALFCIRTHTGTLRWARYCKETNIGYRVGLCFKSRCPGSAIDSLCFSLFLALSCAVHIIKDTENSSINMEYVFISRLYTFTHTNYSHQLEQLC
jgi:hypothetical protein